MTRVAWLPLVGGYLDDAQLEMEMTRSWSLL
jgi:hypothetical protein